MTSRKALRRRLRDHDIQKLKSAPSPLSLCKDSDLFSIDTTGKEEFGAKKSIEELTRHPVVRRLTRPKKKTIVKKKKLKTKAARAAFKAEKFFDIWAEGEASDSRNPAPILAQPTTQPSKTRYLGKGLRPTIPAVVIDRPGCSFNPDAVQHQDMLQRKTRYTHMRSKKESKVPDLDAFAQATMVDELEQFKLGEKGADGDESEGDEGDAIIHRPKIRERKTKAQRNKEGRHRLYLEAIEERKKMKKLHAQINDAKRINREITKDFERRRMRGLKRKAVQENLQGRGVRRMGRKTLYNAPLEVLESPPSSLRALAASNDMALHRYVSLQKRGMIDVGKFRGRKNKTRVKYVNPTAARLRLEDAKEEIPALQKRVQALDNQLRNIKLAEGTSTS